MDHRRSRPSTRSHLGANRAPGERCRQRKLSVSNVPAYPKKPSRMNPFYGHEETGKLCAWFIQDLFPHGSVALAFDNSPPLDSYIAYSEFRTRLSTRVAIFSLYLLRRLRMASAVPQSELFNLHGLFLTAYMIASKVHDDNAYSNKIWTVVGQHLFNLEELNYMERTLCSALDWYLQVPSGELESFESELRREYSRTDTFPETQEPSPVQSSSPPQVTQVSSSLDLVPSNSSNIRCPPEQPQSSAVTVSLPRSRSDLSVFSTTRMVSASTAALATRSVHQEVPKTQSSDLIPQLRRVEKPLPVLPPPISASSMAPKVASRILPGPRSASTSLVPRTLHSQRKQSVNPYESHSRPGPPPPMASSSTRSAAAGQAWAGTRSAAASTAALTNQSRRYEAPLTASPEPISPPYASVHIPNPAPARGRGAPSLTRLRSTAAFPSAMPVGPPVPPKVSVVPPIPQTPMAPVVLPIPRAPNVPACSIPYTPVIPPLPRGIKVPSVPPVPRQPMVVPAVPSFPAPPVRTRPMPRAWSPL